jgi:phosphoglycerate dehydrogenase-like enzyme
MTVTKTILVTGASLVPDEALDLVRRRGFHLRHIKNDHLDRDALAAALDGVAGYVVGGDEKALDEHFSAAADLEAVAWVGTDYRANIPGWRRAQQRGIAIVNTPGANATSVAEFTVLLTLSVVRPLTWVSSVDHVDRPAPGVELHGLRLGLIGAGEIGGRVARMLGTGFGMKVAYSSPRPSPTLGGSPEFARLSRQELLETSDVISLHRPGPLAGEDPELGWTEFKAMRDNAVVVNTAHPGLVDADALCDAIEHKGVRAASDGVGTGESWERLTNKFSGRFLAVPQIGYHTADANLRAGLQAVTKLCDVLDQR